MEVRAVVSHLGIKRGEERPFGLFVIIDSRECLAPGSLMSYRTKQTLRNYSKGDPIQVKIVKIDTVAERVIVMIL